MHTDESRRRGAAGPAGLPIAPSGSITPVFKVLDVQANYGAAASSDLLVVVFYGATQSAALQLMLSRVDTISRTNNRLVSIITVIRPAAPMPDAAARKALEDAFAYMAKENGDVQSAVVFEGSGAKASIVRSVVTGISLIARTPLPIKVFATVTDAAAWLAPRLKSVSTGGAGPILAIIEEMDSCHLRLNAPRQKPA